MGGDAGDVHRASDRGAIGGGEIGAGTARQSAERDDLRNRHRPVKDMALRQIRDPPSSLGQRQTGEMGRIDGEVAARRNEAGEGAEQRRLAGPVRPDHRHELTAPQGQIDAGEHRPAAEVDGGAGNRQGNRPVHDASPVSS